MIHPQTVDYLAEMVIIDLSRIQRNAMECKEMVRRLTTDAKIVLERAGYFIAGENQHALFVEERHFDDPTNLLKSAAALTITGGTVDNAEVVKMLAARGCDEFGRKSYIDATPRGNRQVRYE